MSLAVVMQAGLCAEDADVGVQVTGDGTHVTGTASRKNQWLGARGRPGVLSGSYQFEVEMESACLVRVGWASASSDRTLGLDLLSFGYGGTAMKVNNRKFQKYGEEYYETSGAVVTCLIDRCDPKCETISYCLNGRALGIAFHLPAELAGVPLFPAVCGKETWSACCRFVNLTFPQQGYQPLAEALAAQDAVVAPLVLGLCSEDADACVKVSDDGSHATCIAKGSGIAWPGVRGRPGVLRGRYQYEVELKSQCLLRVGWAALRTKRAIGTDHHSFGFGGTAKKSHSGTFADYGEKYEGQIGAVISCLIDRQDEVQTISYSLNGRNLGVAFEIPKECGEVPLFPAICGKGAWEASCLYSNFAFPEEGYQPLAEALAARDAVAGEGLAGVVAPPKGTLVVTGRELNNAEAMLQKISCAPVEGVVPGKRVVLHVHSGPWQDWYTCKVVDCDPMACYLQHEKDGYTENVPWAFLNGDKYTMEILEDSREADVLGSVDPAPIASDVSTTAESKSKDVSTTAETKSKEEPPSAPPKAGLLRYGRLRVHTELGAGTTLVMCEVGYFASRIELPGQPDLKRGDAIVAIGGTVLLGLEDADLEARFAEGFCDSAVIVFGNYLALRREPFKVVRQEVQRILSQPLSVHPELAAQSGGDRGYSTSVVGGPAHPLQFGPPCCHPLTRSTSTKSSSGASFLKRGRLCVDLCSGQAGLDLSACQAGYAVDGILLRPGQPDLEVGDVIVAIGRSVLLGLEPEEMEERFGDAFSDQAVFVAGPLKELMQWPLETVRHEVELLLTLSSRGPSLLERARTF